MSFILETIQNNYNYSDARAILNGSYLLQYLEKKTKSVDRSSKSRGSFANIYAIYVLIEDYVNHDFNKPENDYSSYPGMAFTDALTRTRELPFGEKLQNHALNDRCNDEFKKFFYEKTHDVPIVRDLRTKKYWINESLLEVTIQPNKKINIAQLCLDIINRYVKLKSENITSFFEELTDLKKIVNSDKDTVIEYIKNTLNPSTDARLFEITSFVILKYYYCNKTVTFDLNGEKRIQPLMLYKVGRTNANDGGIDYIMVPLGRIYQVTEVLDFKKYFLDIDKLIHYPITFVVKQNITPEDAINKIKTDACAIYSENILEHYLDCFEEIITIPTLTNILKINIDNGFLEQMIDEMIIQCQVEYNFSEKPEN